MQTDTESCVEVLKKIYESLSESADGWLVLKVTTYLLPILQAQTINYQPDVQT